MQKKEISIEGVDPLLLLARKIPTGASSSAFPKLHLITRGDTVFAQGAAEDVGRFDEVLRMILWHIERYNALGEDDIHHPIGADESQLLTQSKKTTRLSTVQMVTASRPVPATNSAW